MGQILRKSGQAIMADFGAVSFLIDRVVIGRKHGVLAGAGRVMDRIISAAAAQASKDAVTFSKAPIVLLGARKRPLNAAHPGQEQAGESGANKHFGDRLHINSAMLSRAKEPIALGKEDVNSDFVCLCFRLSVILKYTSAEMLHKGRLVTFSSG